MSSSSSCNPFLPPPPFLHPSVKPHFVTLSSSSFREPKSTKKLTSNQYREPTTVATESRTKKKKNQSWNQNKKHKKYWNPPPTNVRDAHLDVGRQRWQQGKPGNSRFTPTKMPPEGARPTAVTERSSGRVTTVDSAMAKGGKRLSKVAQNHPSLSTQVEVIVFGMTDSVVNNGSWWNISLISSIGLKEPSMMILLGNNQSELWIPFFIKVFACLKIQFRLN